MSRSIFKNGYYDNLSHPHFAQKMRPSKVDKKRLSFFVPLFWEAHGNAAIVGRTNLNNLNKFEVKCV